MVGVCLVLTGCLFWAFGQVLVRRLGDALTGFQLTAWIGMIAAPQMLLASVLIEGDPLPVLASATPADWMAVAYLGVVMTVVGYSAWYFILARYPVPMAMPLLLLLPVSTILGAVSFLGERPGYHVMFGGIIVIGGVAAIIVEPGHLRRLVTRRSG
jgi:O-acetylserine/cysteine efflux transporter